MSSFAPRYTFDWKAVLDDLDTHHKANSRPRKMGGVNGRTSFSVERLRADIYERHPDVGLYLFDTRSRNLLQFTFFFDIRTLFPRCRSSSLFSHHTLCLL